MGRGDRDQAKTRPSTPILQYSIVTRVRSSLAHPQGVPVESLLCNANGLANAMWPVWEGQR